MVKTKIGKKEAKFNVLLVMCFYFNGSSSKEGLFHYCLRIIMMK